MNPLCTRVVTHKNKIRAYCIPGKANMEFQDAIPMPSRTFATENSPIQYDAYPDHQTYAAIMIEYLKRQKITGLIKITLLNVAAEGGEDLPTHCPELRPFDGQRN
ncbi:hypothetical protein AVEN_200806-1 [Araneus ventricosus]|uniref:Uncharacterized protein n=1 Tax=Araneus ventricosus TaxID=182803 RepID=A0A4Y2CFW5_ARAVE|nr:hypothetical protein AVEN_200806-1 [Araneus ventricosus]